MRCDDIYDRHDNCVTPCMCSDLWSHDPKNIGKETGIYKSEGNLSHIRKLLMICVILAWKESHNEKNSEISMLHVMSKTVMSTCSDKQTN